MAKIAVRDWDNKELRKLELADAVFDYPLKQHLIYEAVCAYQAASRAGTHKTKNRKDLSGGSKKLWRQKGTGRARVGDNRSPLWRGGGTVHGPQPRDYSWKLPRRMRRNAIRSVLSQKLRDGELLCIDDLAIPNHQTKELEARLRSGLGLQGKVLLLSDESVDNLELAARNNPKVKVVRALGASVVDLLHHDIVVASESGIKRLTEVLA